MRCVICASEDLEVKTESEYQGEPPHGGMVDYEIGYRCNECDHKESL
jgi:hypothetical protein